MRTVLHGLALKSEEASAGERLGIVVIGRNEAVRLPRCLNSMPAGIPLCYVDSGSSDGSPDLVGQRGTRVLRLSTDQPFTAARARNEGFQLLLREYPGLELVFFIDGDCVLEPGFLASAAAVFASEQQVAIVVGNLSESHTVANVYSRLAALEWSNPGPGEITDFGQLGGIMLVRAEIFRLVAGFDTSFIAGEDSELGIRLFLAGFRTVRIDQAMAQHAMEIDRFGQWWRRSIRAGHALAQRYAKHGRSRLADSRSAVLSTVVYGLALPSGVAIGLLFFGLLGAAPLLGFVYLGSRFFRYYRGKRASRSAALLGSVFGILAKMANAIGLIRFLVQRTRGSFRLIEYK